MLRRIVCLSAEAADWLWRLGAWDRVVAVTAFFDLPPNTPAKPRVGGFSNPHVDEVTALDPDLVITFSDVQADMTAELMRRGLRVLGTNQRSLAEVEATLALLGEMVGRDCEAERLLSEFGCALEPVRLGGVRPRVYFEEWNEPLISGIGWISELIERAGGIDIFAELRANRRASERVVSLEEVCRRNPDVILASWCGRPVQAAHICARAGWGQIAAVRNGRVHEIAGVDILQPGFRLTRGYEQIKEILARIRSE